MFYSYCFMWVGINCKDYIIAWKEREREKECQKKKDDLAQCIVSNK